MRWTGTSAARPKADRPQYVAWSSAPYEWAQEHLVKQDRFCVERMTGFNEGKLLVDGNTSGALGAIWGGVTFAAWYPITPASSLAEALNKYLPQVRCRSGRRQGDLRRHPGRR